MRSLSRLTGFAELLLLAVVLVSWGGSSDAIHFDGGGGGGFSSGFTGRATITVEMTADKTTLPINIIGVGPSPSNAYTNTITVQIKQNGNLFPASSVAISVVSGLSSGALYYLDGDSAHEDDNGNPLAYRRLTFEDTDGIVTAHFLASSTPGTVVLAATATDPNTGQSISANLSLEVTGGGVSQGSGSPSTVNFVMDAAPVYISNNPSGTTTVTQRSYKIFQIFVLDDFGQPINASSGHMIKIDLLDNRPHGGEWLSGTDANGNAQEGTSILVDPIGGAATVVLHSGTLPGTVVISATADRSDNNVENGIETAIANYASVSIGTAEISSLTFSGPLADAVLAQQNALAAQLADPTTLEATDALWNGIFTRFVTVIASDPYGNPPPEGTPITFRLIDSPLDLLKNTYPAQGHGQFAITGYTGDPQEGGLEFYAPNRTVSRAVGDILNPFVVPNGVSYAIADPLCVLMLQDPEVIGSTSSEGRPEYHVGSRIITGRAGNMLVVNTAFNQTDQNVGANVWYAVGCAPHKGSVKNYNLINSDVVGETEISVMTDSSGVASTILNYPASQVGRRFMLAAEAKGGEVGAVMTHWYLGISDSSVLTITQPLQLAQQFATLAPLSDPPPTLVTVTQEVSSGAVVDVPVTLQLLDGGVESGGSLVRTPIPGVTIAVETVITDPSETAAIQAEEAVVTAQAALDAFVAANPGVCDLIVNPDDPETVVERDPELCTQQKAFETALNDAIVASAQARAIANLHTPTVSVAPETLTSGTNGYANLVLHIEDLPTDGKVDFYFSTVGPEVLSETLQITVQPPQAEDTTTQ